MRVVSELISNYQHVIDEMRVVMGSKGVFDVEVDGELIFSKKQVGRQAKTGEVLTAFEKLLGPDVTRYGQ